MGSPSEPTASPPEDAAHGRSRGPGNPFAAGRVAACRGCPLHPATKGFPSAAPRCLTLSIDRPGGAHPAERPPVQNRKASQHVHLASSRLGGTGTGPSRTCRRRTVGHGATADRGPRANRHRHLERPLHDDDEHVDRTRHRRSRLEPGQSLPPRRRQEAWAGRPADRRHSAPPRRTGRLGDQHQRPGGEDRPRQEGRGIRRRLRGHARCRCRSLYARDGAVLGSLFRQPHFAGRHGRDRRRQRLAGTPAASMPSRQCP